MVNKLSTNTAPEPENKPKGRKTAWAEARAWFLLCKSPLDFFLALAAAGLGFAAVKLHMKFLRASYQHMTIAFAQRIMRGYLHGDLIDFQGIRFQRKPFLESAGGGIELYTDIFGAWLYNGDRYDREFCDEFEKFQCEGFYCYEDDGADITVHSGATVLDLGACLGDFAAYAAAKGAAVFAFEPSAETRKLLAKTVELNAHLPGAIEIVPFGAGGRTEELFLSVDAANIGKSKFDGGGSESADIVRVVALDDWVAERGIQVDFIKADIEGFERYMLEGARELLRRQAPVLSLCTYHLPDDHIVMRRLIMEANPDYKIIQRAAKLYAYVPGSL
ncbi:MAG: FkbM family methyltransferase [Gracilibacteraceae bacterium]|jgi:FkbM family methyltransferase|nr:FkbM family methyltransferase [Gracilibacteraceae bacterium]